MEDEGEEEHDEMEEEEDCNAQIWTRRACATGAGLAAWSKQFAALHPRSPTKKGQEPPSSPLWSGRPQKSGT